MCSAHVHPLLPSDAGWKGDIFKFRSKASKHGSISRDGPERNHIQSPMQKSTVVITKSLREDEYSKGTMESIT
jgi:hypothetical protein